MRNSPALVLAIILIVGTGMRLFHLSGPPVDHHWLRQYDTAAMARNFADPGSSILYPRVDWGGASPGYVESEFPLYQYVTGLLYRVFGEREAIPRLLSILCYLVGAVFLFLFSRDEFDEATALIAVTLYTILPLSWFFTRSIQPDSLAASASVGAIYLFSRWCRTLSVPVLIAAALALTVSALIKPTNLCLGLPIAVLCFRHFRWRALTRVPILLFGVVVLGAVFAWFRHAKGLADTYGNTLYGAYPVPFFPEFPVHHSRQLILRFIEYAATPVAFPFMVIGILASIPGRGVLALSWLAAYLVPAFVISDQFIGHDYYMLPMLLPASAFIGHGMMRLRETGLVNPRWLVLCTLLILLFSMSYYRRWFKDEAWHRQRIAFGAKVEEMTRPEDRLIAAKEHAPRPGWYQRTMADGNRSLDYSPVDHYLSRRKGWCIDSQNLNLEFIEQLRELGATHLSYFVHPGFPLILSETPVIENELVERYQLIYRGDDGSIFDLRPESKQ